jgi:coenzyme A diphosphatase NUDT7
MRSFPGQVCLPGGKRDPEDVDDVAVALREAWEELGLPAERVKVCGVMAPFLSRRGISVTPVLGFIDPPGSQNGFDMNINKDEVHVTFDAPLALFLEKSIHYRHDELQLLDTGPILRTHYFDYLCEGTQFCIWGITASILIKAAAACFGRQPEFPTDTPDGPRYSQLVWTPDPTGTYQAVPRQDGSENTEPVLVTTYNPTSPETSDGQMMMVDDV